MANVQPAYFVPRPLADYALLDSGGGQKLERFGSTILCRPDPQALWAPRLERGAWVAADWTFVRESDRGGRWEPCGGGHSKPPEPWGVKMDGVTLEIRPQAFKHVGLFPEQASNWSWVEKRGQKQSGELLNLFGYTGAASLMAARSGFEVTHVDASKTAVAWARENAEANEIEARWIVDDAAAFVEREARRGHKYMGVLLDPPHFGRGPRRTRGASQETWRFEEDIAPLLKRIIDILEPTGFLVLSTYAIGTSPLSLANLLTCLPEGQIDAGELVLAEESIERAPTRLLPAGFCARWRGKR